MNGTEIVNLLASSIPIVMNSMVSAVTGGVITAIYLRYNTSVKEFEKIKAGQFKEVTEELLKSGKMTYAEFYKTDNFLNIAEKADKYYLEIQHEKITKKYDFDWFVEFYEAVGNSSDEKKQDLWAKTFAYEVNNPGLFSRRTIEIIRMISPDEVELFEKVSEYVLYTEDEKNLVIDYFIPWDEKIFNSLGITFPNLLTLEDAGLFMTYGSIAIDFELKKGKKKEIFAGEKCVIEIHNTEKEQMVFSKSVFLLSEAGREIYKAIYMKKINTTKDAYYIQCKAFFC